MNEEDPNAYLFGDSEPEDPEKEHIESTFGKNPNRTSALSDIFGKELIETVLEDPDIPDEGRFGLIFKMAANSVLDIVLESLDPETREEVCESLDGYIGMCIVNKKFEVDLFGELTKALMNVTREEGESDEDFEERLENLEEAWWSIAQPKLNGRNPNDAITEEIRKYGLDR